MQQLIEPLCLAGMKPSGDLLVTWRFLQPLGQPGSKPELELLSRWPLFVLFCLRWLQKACVCVCWTSAAGRQAGSGQGHYRKLYWGHSAGLSSWPRLWVCAPRAENNTTAPWVRSNKEAATLCMCVWWRGGELTTTQLSSQQLIGRWGAGGSLENAH